MHQQRISLMRENSSYSLTLYITYDVQPFISYLPIGYIKFQHFMSCINSSSEWCRNASVLCLHSHNN